MSLTGKSPSETYKDIAYVDNSNNGVTTSLKQVKTGNGSSTALQVSDRSLQVKSATNNTTALDVQNASGTSKLLVDTTNNYVKANGVHVNTMYKEFGAFQLGGTTQNYYYPLPCDVLPSANDLYEPDNNFMGTSPATSLDLSSVTSAKEYLVASMWYITDNITIDSAKLFHNTGGHDINCKIFSYDFVEGQGATGGDLSNGTQVCTGPTGGDIAASSNSIGTQALTISSANVSSGKVVLAMVKNCIGTNNITARIKIKYHITG